MKRCRAFTLTAAAVVGLATVLLSAPAAFGATPGAGKLGLDDPLCASKFLYLRRRVRTAERLLRRPRRAFARVQVEHPRVWQQHDVLDDAAEGPDAVQPTAFGALDSTTWNFQLRPTFWFGLTLCDTESAPEYTKTCKPDSDSNNLVGTNPKAANYIGKHPGNAFMELQFDGPGYVPQFEGFGCDATHYCAVMTIDSRTARPEQRRSRLDRYREHGRVQRVHSRRPRADQLGVGHQERRLPGACESAVHRDRCRPEFLRGQPESV